MFERYTERARRVIFFARFEASQHGSVMIEVEHCLLGLIRERKELIDDLLLATGGDSRELLKKIESIPLREKTSTTIDLPFSSQSKQILAFVAEEADSLRHCHIGTEHLLLGILRQEESLAVDVLREQGLTLEVVREKFANLTHSNDCTHTPSFEDKLLALLTSIDKRLGEIKEKLQS